MTQPHPSNKLPAFDGLRGIAAIVVLIHHLRLTFYIHSTARIGEYFASLPWPVARLSRAFVEGLYNGAFAVWVFWVMSAFVLSLQFFLRARDLAGARAHDYLEDAALRRYPRLFLPVLASVMFAYGLDAMGLVRNQELAHTLGPPYEPGWLSSWNAFEPRFLGALESAAWSSFFAYDPLATYNSALWTMGPEFFGSLSLFSFLALFGHRGCRLFLYPVLALCLRKLRLDWMEAFLGGILLCDLYVNGKGAMPSSKILDRSIEFLRGSVVAAVICWLVIIVLAGFFDYRGLPNAILACFAVGVTLVSLPTRRLFSTPIPGFLGRISFGLYLIHISIIFSFGSWAYLKYAPVHGHDGTVIVVCLATCVLSILGGYCLYAWVDRPSITLSRWLSAKIMRRPSHVAPPNST